MNIEFDMYQTLALAVLVLLLGSLPLMTPCAKYVWFFSLLRLDFRQI